MEVKKVYSEELEEEVIIVSPCESSKYKTFALTKKEARDLSEMLLAVAKNKEGGPTGTKYTWFEKGFMEGYALEYIEEEKQEEVIYNHYLKHYGEDVLKLLWDKVMAEKKDK